MMNQPSLQDFFNLQKPGTYLIICPYGKAIWHVPIDVGPFQVAQILVSIMMS